MINFKEIVERALSSISEEKDHSEFHKVAKAAAGDGSGAHDKSHDDHYHRNVKGTAASNDHAKAAHKKLTDNGFVHKSSKKVGSQKESSYHHPDGHSARVVHDQPKTARGVEDHRHSVTIMNGKH